MSGTAQQPRPQLRAALGQRVVIADGTIGSMLQASPANLGNLGEYRVKVIRLLRPDRIGVSLSEEFQLAPEQSTDALIAHHPEAKYFST